MIYTIVLSLLLTFPALSLIEILHVKKFTKLWTIIMVIFGCLSFNLEVFFLNIIVMGKTGIKNKIKFTHDWGLDNFVLTPRGTEGIKQFGVKEKILNFLK